MNDELIVPEKTSRWTDAERDGTSAPAEVSAPVTADDRPPLPPWLGAFGPGSTFEHQGWTVAVRHVGYEGGMWMFLAEPVDYKEPRSVSRSEFRRLRTQLGKKEARKVLAARGQTVPATEEVESASPNDTGCVAEVRPNDEGSVGVDRGDQSAGSSPLRL